MMPVATIEFDNELDAQRYAATSQGWTFCDFAPHSKKRIAIWRPGGRGTDTSVVVKKLVDIGATWRKKDGYWTVPLSFTNLKELEKIFGSNFEPTEALDEWGYAEKDKISSLDNLSSASSDAELSKAVKDQAPMIYHSAFPYQRAGIVFGALTRRYGLFDQPGLGKTMQTFGAIVESGVSGDILVLAPTVAVALTWPDEIKKWLPGDECVVVNGSGPRRRKLLDDVMEFEPTGKRRWVIVNLEMARAEWIKPGKEFRYPKTGPGSRKSDNPQKRFFVKPGWWNYSYPQIHLDQVIEGVPPWAGIVVDESHRALICHTSFLQSQTLVRAGMAQIPLAEDGMKIALSGTPMRGKVENLWGTLNWLYPEKYNSYWDWAKRWFMVWENEETKESTIQGLNESKTAEFYQDIKPYILRRTKKEVRSELPDKLYAGTPLPDEDGNIDETSPVAHWLEMAPKQAKAYQEMVDNAEVDLESGILTANGTLAQLTRLKQFASCSGDLTELTKRRRDGTIKLETKLAPQLPSNKFDWLVEFLDDLGINKNSSMEVEQDGEEEIRKVVIASQFTSLIDLFDEELNKKGIKTLKITGKVKDHERKRAAHRYQEVGGPRVFLLNTMAGGVSLTLDSADDLVLLDETFIPDDQEQVEDRIHRASRMHQVTIHYLRSIGTVEETIALTTGSRERLTKQLLDGERGVPFFRKLLTPIVRKTA